MTAPPPLARVQRPRRRLPGALPALLALLWFGIAQDLAARAATGLASQWLAGLLVPLLRPVFLLFLLGLGLVLLEGGRRATDGTASLAGLVRRPGAGREWALGAAVGWGVAVLAMLPLVLRGRLLLTFWTEPRGWISALIAALSALLLTLASEIVYHGYALPRLRESVGLSAAVLLLSLLYGLAVGLPFGNGRVVLVAALFGLLLATGWVRSHAIWISWGAHFAWTVALGILFGLPSFDGGDLSSIVQGQVRGRSHWLGSPSGPVAAWWTVPAMVIGILVLLRVTRDYAWRYTHAPIVAAGYPMDVKPPAAHGSMAEGAAAPPPLVQILPSPPTGASLLPSPPPGPK